MTNQKHGKAIQILGYNSLENFDKNKWKMNLLNLLIKKKQTTIILI